MPIFTPDWFKTLDLRDPDDVRIKNRYLIKSAALAFTPNGTHEALAAALDLSMVSLSHTYSPRRGRISPELAVRLEKTLGADVLPRKLLRPDIFF